MQKKYKIPSCSLSVYKYKCSLRSVAFLIVLHWKLKPNMHIYIPPSGYILPFTSIKRIRTPCLTWPYIDIKLCIYRLTWWRAYTKTIQNMVIFLLFNFIIHAVSIVFCPTLYLSERVHFLILEVGEFISR